MNTMNMPGFTARASLYKNSRHYRTSRNAIDLSEQVTGPIHPAMINLDGIDCGSCVGGECAALNCFENWTHGGGGGGVDPRGPYVGGGRDFGGDGGPRGRGGWQGPKTEATGTEFCCASGCTSRIKCSQGSQLTGFCDRNDYPHAWCENRW